MFSSQASQLELSWRQQTLSLKFLREPLILNIVIEVAARATDSDIGAGIADPCSFHWSKASQSTGKKLILRPSENYFLNKKGDSVKSVWKIGLIYISVEFPFKQFILVSPYIF